MNYKDQSRSEDVYTRLAKYLDDMPAGFPKTESGVELRILKRLFTKEEAALALHVTLIPEEVRVIARRAKITLAEAENHLEIMAKKGLIYNFVNQGKRTTYMSNQMVIGIWEYHVNDLNHDLIRDMNEYSSALFEEAWKVPQLRTIPVNQSITAKMEVSTYERANELIKEHKRIAVAPCICRREKHMRGEGCQAPEEACLVLGAAADYYLRNGLGRRINHDEAIAILNKADEAGLVIQPSNSKRAANICCCCACCCVILGKIKHYPVPADLVSSPFQVAVNAENCDGCGVCTERCPMEALSLQSDTSTVDYDRCIGCGLCVTTCPTDSLALFRKPQKEQPKVPKNNQLNYINLGRRRGKLNTGKMVMMVIRSKMDRLLTLK